LPGPKCARRLTAASDDALRIDSKLTGVLLEPANSALCIRDTNTFLALPFGNPFAWSRPTSGNLPWRSPVPGSRSSCTPCETGSECHPTPAAVEQYHARHLRLCRIVVRREIDLHLARLSCRLFVDVDFPPARRRPSLRLWPTLPPFGPWRRYSFFGPDLNKEEASQYV